MYGHVSSIGCNASVNITTPLPMLHWAHLYCSVRWSGVYWQHSAIAWVNDTTISITNYRSAGNGSYNLAIDWLIFC